MNHPYGFDEKAYARRLRNLAAVVDELPNNGRAKAALSIDIQTNIRLPWHGVSDEDAKPELDLRHFRQEAVHAELAAALHRSVHAFANSMDAQRYRLNFDALCDFGPAFSLPMQVAWYRTLAQTVVTRIPTPAMLTCFSLLHYQITKLPLQVRGPAQDALDTLFDHLRATMRAQSHAKAVHTVQALLEKPTYQGLVHEFIAQQRDLITMLANFPERPPALAGATLMQEQKYFVHLSRLIGYVPAEVRRPLLTFVLKHAHVLALRLSSETLRHMDDLMPQKQIASPMPAISALPPVPLEEDRNATAETDDAAERTVKATVACESVIVRSASYVKQPYHGEMLPA